MTKRKLFSTANIVQLAFRAGRFLPFWSAPYLAAIWAGLALYTADLLLQRRQN